MVTTLRKSPLPRERTPAGGLAQEFRKIQVFKVCYGALERSQGGRNTTTGDTIPSRGT
jgi:hypothetical protein